jgi:pyridoxal phosphate enzyme (YggS family)
VRQRIAEASRKAGRVPADVTLVAVTKTVLWEQVEPWIAAGVVDCGENRVQEALGKFATPEGSKKIAGRFHLIGPLQTNKAKKAVQFFDLIQSLDRLDLAKELNRHAAAAGKIMPCLVEVKVSDEPSKAGLAPEALREFLDAVRAFPHVAVQGLMGIPPANAAGDAARPYFARLRKLLETSGLKTLSMGMSSDFETAIEEGSTMVRLGTVLFGARA